MSVVIVMCRYCSWTTKWNVFENAAAAHGSHEKRCEKNPKNIARDEDSGFGKVLCVNESQLVTRGENAYGNWVRGTDAIYWWLAFRTGADSREWATVHRKNMGSSNV